MAEVLKGSSIGEVAKATAQVSFSTGVPVSLGVNTTDTNERAGTKAGNRDADAAVSQLELINLLGKL